MRRTRWLLLFLLFTLACRALAPGPLATLTPTGAPARDAPTQTAPAPTRGTPTENPPPATCPRWSCSPGVSFSVLLHPDGGLYAGDQVSLEVIAPPGVEARVTRCKWMWTRRRGLPWAASASARMGWWSASRLPCCGFGIPPGCRPGEHVLSFSILPAGPTWSETVTLLPASSLPAAEQAARWAEAESACCVVHYITGSDAERDLPTLLSLADEHAAQVSQQLGAEFPEKVHLTLLPRLLGHGGFASGEIAISYGEGNYAGGQFPLVLHHELAHFLDGKINGSLRPSLLGEGLAVYLSGGHFKPEALLPRLAALLELGGYLPLQPLADNFYPAQHETGYLEGAALVEFMVDAWGWQAFWDFYRAIQPHPSGSQASAIDLALQEHFDLSFAELEERFLERLRAKTVDPAAGDDIRLTMHSSTPCAATSGRSTPRRTTSTPGWPTYRRRVRVASWPITCAARPSRRISPWKRCSSRPASACSRPITSLWRRCWRR